MTSDRLRYALLLFVTAVHAGCALFASFDKGGGTAGDPRRYVGSECRGLELEKANAFVRDASGTRQQIVTIVSHQPTRTDPLPLRVAKVACGENIRHYPDDGGEPAYVQYHHDFDTRRFDHRTAALILTMCNKDTTCLADPPPNVVVKPWVPRYAAGLVLYYADAVDPLAVDQALSEAGVSSELRAHFGAELERARAKAREVAAKLTGSEARVFVGIPGEVRKEREIEDAKYAELFARFDTLAAQARQARAKGVDDATVLALEDLRREYVKACGDLTCLDRGLGVWIARELFFSHVSRNDPLGAQAELGLVSPAQPIEVARDIDRRQRDAMKGASEAQRKQAKLRDQGVDEDTANTVTRGAVAHDFAEVSRWSFERIRRMDWLQLLPGGREPRHHRGRLAAKQAQGETMLLRFADKVEKYADEVCRDTNKVRKIESDGRLVYHQRCQATGKTVVDRTKIEPVVVPAREASLLSVGDDVALVVAGDKALTGRVHSASRRGALVQVRDVRRK